METQQNSDHKKQIQPALTIPQQIANLKELGLIIADEDEAEEFLNNISYYRFIKAYSLGLKQRNGSFHDGVTFDQLVQLYNFNTEFRHLLFEQIERIEITLRCRLANYFSLAHGAMGYLDEANFENYPEEFARGIQREIGRNCRSSIVQNFKRNYEGGNIPFYAAVEVLSFGTLSKFYKNLIKEDKKAIASTYDVHFKFFESWIESIAYVRNICAHYGRLYNGKLTKTPKLYQEDIERGITNKRVMGILICMKHLLPDDQHWIDFINDIEKLTKKYPSVKVWTMGFPENWKELLLGNTASLK